jgi:hypothetical protein
MMLQVIQKVKGLLNLQEHRDPWHALLHLFTSQHALVEGELRATTQNQPAFSEASFNPFRVLDGQLRYPRDKRRSDALAVMLNDAGAGGAAYEEHITSQREDRDKEVASTGGSMPVSHLLASQFVTNTLWAKVFK